ncbi:hypothetical protein M0R45_028000 [Rubus argutus]|uniref:Protein kinase domain-containing protein n=1 Tax=Rubus argutus TaxID=59490 RepID=A0AAW1W4K0_RUBAR
MILSSVWLTCTVTATILGSVICGEQCLPASCGDLHDIRYPFRLKINGTSDPNCSSHPAELSCEHNRTILNLYNGTYYVLAIDYENYAMQVVDSGLLRDTCPFRPLHGLTTSNFSDADPYKPSNPYEYVAFFDCLFPVDESYYIRINCSTSTSSSSTYSYVTVGNTVDHLHDSCTISSIIMRTQREMGIHPSFSAILDELRRGFTLTWAGFLLGNVKSTSRIHFLNVFLFSRRLEWILEIRTPIGIFVLLVFLSYKLYSKKFLKDDKAVEEFLDAYKNLMPRRYSYSEIKKMTLDFKVKLGEGGFGSVYKGELSNGHLVAVKMLDGFTPQKRKDFQWFYNKMKKNKLSGNKGKGQDFINEVSTIGRIHHVNVVQLIGFCSEGSKRALIYDFMPNGSLEKYIFSEKGKNLLLSWDIMHEIALGVARGIEYLHRGCEMQILHFDIKPHNILLDENFKSKISDFGLARFYPRDQNTISVTCARGTTGYVAPEMHYKTIGGVSYKADVYSFGMLLLEMAGRRKNLNAHVEKSSQIYFPSWIHEQLEKGLNIEIEDACDGDKEIVKKMIMVALWCIQLMPADRPSMSKVVEMLEEKVEVLLQMPPKPYYCPQFVPTKDLPDEEDNEDVCILPDSAMESTSMV